MFKDFPARGRCHSLMKMSTKCTSGPSEMETKLLTLFWDSGVGSKVIIIFDDPLTTQFYILEASVVTIFEFLSVSGKIL